MPVNLAVRSIKTVAELGLIDIFASARRGLPGGRATSAARADAFETFTSAGLPSSRSEAWKYTDLRRLMRDAKPLASPPGLEARARARARRAGEGLADIAARRLVVIDGVFVPDVSDLDNLEPGLAIRSMASALHADEPLLSHGLGSIVPADDPALALNTALAADGVVVTIAPGVKLERPIHLAFVATSLTAEAMFMRSLVSLGSRARATLVETHEGPSRLDYQVNTVTQLIVGKDARFEHVKITREGRHALHLGTLLANLGARARLSTFGFVTGGAAARNQVYARLSGPGAVASFAGLSLLADRQHADTTLVIDHAEEGGESRELFKSVLDDHARSVFQGKITVRRNAQKTDAKMMSRALLLSDRAEADCKPELEIFADDVKCGHGSTTGALDEQLKFYLMARGIPAKEAESLLIQAFAGEALDQIEHEGVREALVEATARWLAGRG